MLLLAAAQATARQARPGIAGRERLMVWRG